MDLNKSSEDEYQNNIHFNVSKNKQKKYRIREKLKVEEYSIYESKE